MRLAALRFAQSLQLVELFDSSAPVMHSQHRMAATMLAVSAHAQAASAMWPYGSTAVQLGRARLVPRAHDLHGGAPSRPFTPALGMGARESGLR